MSRLGWTQVDSISARSSSLSLVAIALRLVRGLGSIPTRSATGSRWPNGAVSGCWWTGRR